MDPRVMSKLSSSRQRHSLLLSHPPPSFAHVHPGPAQRQPCANKVHSILRVFHEQHLERLQVQAMRSSP